MKTEQNQLTEREKELIKLTALGYIDAISDWLHNGAVIYDGKGKVLPNAVIGTKKGKGNHTLTNYIKKHLGKNGITITGI